MTEAAFTYPMADEIADFGAAQASLSLRIRPMGRAVPLGVPVETTILR